MAMISAASPEDHCEFRIGESEIASHQQEQADHGGERDLARRIEDSASGGGADCQHDESCNREAQRAHERGRDGLHRNVDGEIGRAPEQVHQSEGENHHPPAWALSGVHCGHKQGKAKDIRRDWSTVSILNGGEFVQFSFAYSAFAVLRTGISGSASFQAAKKS